MYAASCLAEPRRGARPVLWLLGLLLVAALISLPACGPRTDTDGRHQLAQRLIDQEPPEVLDFAALQEQEPVFAASFSAEPAVTTEEGEDIQGWTIGGEYRLNNRGLRISRKQKEMRLTYSPQLPASDMQRLEVKALCAQPTTLVLQWAAPGEEFSKRHRMIIQLKPHRSGKPQRYFLELDQEPKWKGTIDRLQITLKPRRRSQLVLEEIRGLRENIGPAGLEKALRQPWKVDLGEDIRNAWLTVPGFHIERTVNLEKASVLRFEYALSETRDLPMTLRLRVASQKGEEASTLFEQELDPSKPRALTWQTAEVDLSDHGGKEAQIFFETHSSEPIEGFEGFATWANPRILAPAGSTPGPPNIVLISIDTLRADRMSVYGHERPTTPRLEAWASSSAAVFERAIAQAPWTLPSHTSMLSGLNTFRHGVNHNSPAPPSLDLLAEYLRPKGYSTLAITGGGFVHPDYGLGQGFDRFRYWPRGTSHAREEFDKGLKGALTWLEESTDHPFFLFFHTYEVHQSSALREPYFSQFSELEFDSRLRLLNPDPTAEEGFRRSRHFALEVGTENGQRIFEDLPPELAALPRDIYDTGVAVADEGMSTLFDKISALGLSENTIILITSDHGELLGEDGDAGHVYLWEENLHIPLMLDIPGVTQGGQRIPQQVRSVDIVPTLLELAGVDPPATLDGRSLLPLLRGETKDFPNEAWSTASVSNRGIALRLRNQLKYIFSDSVWAPFGGEETLYDLRSDPEEKSNLAADNEQIEALRGQLLETLEQQHGLRIRFHNEGQQSYQVVLWGSAFTRGKIKSLDLSCPCVRWVDPNDVVVEVPPGQHFTLRIEDVKDSSSMQFRSPDGENILSPGLEEITDMPIARELLAGIWGAVETPGEEPAVGFEVWWHGAKQLGQAAPEESNPELREQLEALGYL